MSNTLQQVAVLLGRGVVPTATPVVGVDDLGLTRGHGCFDATRVRFAAGVADIDVLELHIARLHRSAAALGIPCPEPAAWHDLTQEACRVYAGDGEAMLKLVLTGGGETLPAGPVAYVTLTEIGEETLRQREGITVATLSRGVASDAYADAPWLLGGVKTIAYATNLAAKEEAHRRGADDTLFVSTDGFALEAPTSAIVVRHGRELATTPTGASGVLASITIDRIAEAAPQEGYTLTHRLFTPAEVCAADGAWFVSSVRGVAPIRRLDDVDLPTDTTGDDVVRRLAGF